MSLSSVELWQRISSAGLAAPLICRSWAADALQRLQPSDATDAEKILEQLVQLGRLTEYQADLIAGRRQGEFKRGAWTLLRPVTVPLWEGWFEAVKSPTESPSWLRWISNDALAEIRDAGPSLPRGLQLARAKGPNLQTVFIPELIEKQLQLQVQPVLGVPLVQAINREPNLGTQAAKIVRQVAEALRPMHAVQLAHGRVMPDRIFVDANAVKLIRDPICSHSGSLAAKSSGVIQAGLGGLSPAQFMAPEFLAPGQQPTPSSDIYSLGCVWWWLVTGKPIVVGSTLDKQLARQAEASIALPKDCSLAPPLLRCLQHCLAKNLPARFATADALCEALDAALASVAKGPSQRSSKAVSKQASKPAQKEAQKPVSSTPIVAAIVAAKVVEQTPAPDSNAPGVETVVAAVASTPAVEAVIVESQPTVASAVKPTVDRAKQIERGTADPRSLEAKVAKPTAAVKAEQVPVAAKAKPVVPKATEQKAAAEVKPVTSLAPNKITETEQSNEPEFVVPAVTRKATAKTGRKKVKRKPANQWVLTVLGGLIAICLLLGVLIASGTFKTVKRTPVTNSSDIVSQLDVPTEFTTDLNNDPAPTDPRLEMYRIVESGKDLLWAPPAAPEPIELDMLPPGGQMFLTLHPKRLLGEQTSKSLLAVLNEDVSKYLEQIGKRSGVPLEAIESVTVAFFAENEIPMTCLRVQLVMPQSLAVMKNAWESPADEKVDGLTLLSSSNGDSYFVAQQPLSDAQSVSEFSVGPTKLMRESVELQGAAGPLVSQVEKLWGVSDANADFSLLVATPFLFSEGKAILAQAPPRLSRGLRDLLQVDTRAALVQTRFEPQWYVEMQLAGTSEREAPRLNELLHQRISGAAGALEEWFVSEQPHPYWRSLAIRYPQMLRVFAEQSRFGIENGVAVANAYLPSEAATNILLSTWIAAQEGATLASDAPMEASAASTAKPLTMDEYLARPIKLSFDQEPIESALRLVGEEANANLPSGSPQLRFALDGGAFERAGITRNQQLRDFQHINLPMRDALTAIAKRGNPVTTVKDTREQDQRLIWVVRDDPEQAGKQMISLTTRAEASANNIPLPIEFAPAP